MKAKYLDPFTDFGFKKIFGEEASKPLLLDFLNSLLPAELQIKNLSSQNIEDFGYTLLNRKSLFDIHCETLNGEHFMVEFQNNKANQFYKRLALLLSCPILSIQTSVLYGFCQMFNSDFFRTS